VNGTQGGRPIIDKGLVYVHRGTVGEVPRNMGTHVMCYAAKSAVGGERGFQGKMNANHKAPSRFTKTQIGAKEAERKLGLRMERNFFMIVQKVGGMTGERPEPHSRKKWFREKTICLGGFGQDGGEKLGMEKPKGLAKGTRSWGKKSREVSVGGMTGEKTQTGSQTSVV